MRVYIILLYLYFEDYLEKRDQESSNDYDKRFNNYITLISIDVTYSGDFEFAVESIVLNKAKNVYRNTLKDEFKFINSLIIKILLFILYLDIIKY